MAKRPTSRSQADDTAAAADGASRPRRPRTPKSNAPQPPGAPVPPEPQPVRADANDERSIDRDPGARPPASRDAVTSESPSGSGQPTEDDIRVRAYHRYLERGGSHGREVDDWVEAEKELKKTP
jgi:hypothetical protein